MSLGPDQPSAQPFFMQASVGNRFCMYYPPARAEKCLGAILYVPPFAEEMNKSRRMAALQARAFSAKGYAVLQVDLFGCGDSEGDFGQARWNIWKEDLALAVSWLQNAVAAPLSVWALRLGALLAIDFIHSANLSVNRLLLWQPALEGKNFLTQFLRLRIAGDMLANEDKEALTVNALRAKIAIGECVEVAGYNLPPDLANAIDGAQICSALSNVDSIHWFELVTQAAPDMSPGRSKLLQSISSRAGPPALHLVTGDQFWSAAEPADCAALIASTLDTLDEI